MEVSAQLPTCLRPSPQQPNPQETLSHYLWLAEIQVMDHKPLMALFRPIREIPLLSTNQLARWALWLNKFDYTIEYQKSADYGNADAFSCLLSGNNNFDIEESGEDMEMVRTIKVLSLQVKPVDTNILRQESGKDPVITTVMHYVHEGWPLNQTETNEKV